MPERQPQHKKFISSLSPEEKILIILRDELYDGSWDKMLKDLEDRLKQRPYIFKLVSRINEDITRIKKLQKYEKEHNINLKDFIKEEK